MNILDNISSMYTIDAKKFPSK
ncbi:SMI1/KNR4 family protein, partial [Priestia megaterium]